YACLWWSFQRFYAAFGVSPQDVGLAPSGNATDLAGAALQLGIWLLIALAVFAVLPTLAVATAEIAVDVGGAAASVLIGLALLLLAATGWLYWWLVDGFKGLATIAVAAAVFALLQYG